MNTNILSNNVPLFSTRSSLIVLMIMGRGEADDDDVEENDVKENDDDVEEDGVKEDYDDVEEDGLEEDCGCVFATY